MTSSEDELAPLCSLCGEDVLDAFEHWANDCDGHRGPIAHPDVDDDQGDELGGEA